MKLKEIFKQPFVTRAELATGLHGGERALYFVLESHCLTYMQVKQIPDELISREATKLVEWVAQNPEPSHGLDGVLFLLWLQGVHEILSPEILVHLDLA